MGKHEEVINVKRWFCAVLAVLIAVSMLSGCVGEMDSLKDDEREGAYEVEVTKTEPSEQQEETEPAENNGQTEPTEEAVSPIEDFSYEMENGEVTITGYKGVDREIRIPAEIYDRPVTQIGTEAFAGYDMVSVVVPDGVRVISSEAFCDCQCLTDLTLPSTLETIEGSAFKNCVLLESVDLPDSLLYLGGNAFANSGLKRLCIPSDTVFERGSTTFKETDADGKVEYISKEIINNPIRDCDAYLVVEAGSKALEQIKSFGTLALKYKVAGLKPEDYFEFHELMDGSLLLSAYSGLDEIIEVPEKVNGKNVTAILERAFVNSEIKEVHIPASVTFIGEFAFRNCDYLEKVVFEGEGEVRICENAFEDCAVLLEIELPRGAWFDKKKEKVLDEELMVEVTIMTEEPLWPLAEGDQTVLIVEKDSKAYEDLVSEYNDGKVKYRVK